MTGEPIDAQYKRFKAQHPDCVLLFRVGDFYQMLDEDALKVSGALGLTLTRRTGGGPMCAVPYSQLEQYLRKLILAEFRVAICEQVSEPVDTPAKSPGVIDPPRPTRQLTLF